MNLAVRNTKELYAGAIFVVVGVAVFLGAQEYEIGAATQMGPGYFPACLALLLVAVGIGACLHGVLWGVHGRVDHKKLLPLLLILAGVVSFRYLVDSAGLVAAVMALTLFACLDRIRTRPIETLLICVILSAFAVAVFIYGFDMQFRAF